MARLVSPRLADMVGAIEHIRSLVESISLDAFESNWQTKWLVERGLEIISEASRHLPDDLKARWPDIPWRMVAGIGNVLRHDYQRVAADVLWKVATEDLPELEKVCRRELALALERESDA